jgi:hypothetical protein
MDACGYWGGRFHEARTVRRRKRTTHSGGTAPETDASATADRYRRISGGSAPADATEETPPALEDGVYTGTGTGFRAKSRCRPRVRGTIRQHGGLLRTRETLSGGGYDDFRNLGAQSATWTRCRRDVQQQRILEAVSNALGQSLNRDRRARRSIGGLPGSRDPAVRGKTISEKNAAHR